MDDERRDLALHALSLLHDETAGSDGPVDALEVAEGQAYLNGFVIQMLADAMHVTVPEALDHIRRTLGGGGDGAGDREPRWPDPAPPALAAERSLDDTD